MDINLITCKIVDNSKEHTVDNPQLYGPWNEKS